MTHAIRVGGIADLVALRRLASDVAVQLLLQAAARSVERLIELCKDRIVLQLTVPRRIGRERDVCLVLEERVVPPTTGISGRSTAENA